MTSVRENCVRAHAAKEYAATLTTAQKNEALSLMADALVSSTDEILRANAVDLAASADKPKHILDRLMLDEKRVAAMSDGLKKLTDLPDPIGEVMDEWRNHADLLIKKVRVPLGVIGIIYEARPNVTADAIGLCLKTGNAIVLRGSKDAYNSNRAIVDAMSRAIEKRGYKSDFIQLIDDLSHESSVELMTARGLVDVLIPRGSAKLINAVATQSTVPVIETGTGNCHAYVHKTADFDLAEKVILNGKLRRPSVCNALESLLVDREIAPAFLPKMLSALNERGVEIRGCGETCAIYPQCTPATEDDYYTEYLDLIISCKVVADADEAIRHINKYGSGHSETILARDESAVKAFMERVDSAAVYHNASTAFTDGFEYGFGAEMGISTQKLHARGPLGLKELTSFKYRIYGNGQTRK